MVVGQRRGRLEPSRSLPMTALKSRERSDLPPTSTGIAPARIMRQNSPTNIVVIPKASTPNPYKTRDITRRTPGRALSHSMDRSSNKYDPAASSFCPTSMDCLMPTPQHHLRRKDTTASSTFGLLTSTVKALTFLLVGFGGGYFYNTFGGGPPGNFATVQAHIDLENIPSVLLTDHLVKKLAHDNQLQELEIDTLKKQVEEARIKTVAREDQNAVVNDLLQSHEDLPGKIRIGNEEYFFNGKVNTNNNPSRFRSAVFKQRVANGGGLRAVKRMIWDDEGNLQEVTLPPKPVPVVADVQVQPPEHVPPPEPSESEDSAMHVMVAEQEKMYRKEQAMITQQTEDSHDDEESNSPPEQQQEEQDEEHTPPDQRRQQQQQNILRNKNPPPLTQEEAEEEGYYTVPVPAEYVAPPPPQPQDYSNQRGERPPPKEEEEEAEAVNDNNNNNNGDQQNQPEENHEQDRNIDMIDHDIMDERQGQRQEQQQQQEQWNNEGDNSENKLSKQEQALQEQWGEVGSNEEQEQVEEPPPPQQQQYQVDEPPPQQVDHNEGLDQHQQQQEQQQWTEGDNNSDNQYSKQEQALQEQQWEQPPPLQ